jgi:methionine synthase I (cobalamin-dependent)
MDPTMPNNSFMDRMRGGGVLFDGGMGSMLIANGLEPGAPPEEWNRSKPQLITAVHAAYIAAGSDVITTNTFGATPSRFNGYGLGDELANLNNAGVRIAREAIDQYQNTEQTAVPDRYVAFSMGPTGKLLPPVGKANEEEIESEFVGQLESLEERVDLVLGETFFDIREALVALRAAKRVADTPVGISITFTKTPRGFFTMMGDTVADTFDRLATGGADFVAANCSVASDDMLELSKLLRAATNLPILCQPNAGAPTVENGIPVYAQPPEDFADDIGNMIEVGINAVGGCCGTNPEFIRLAAQRIRDTIG